MAVRIAAVLPQVVTQAATQRDALTAIQGYWRGLVGRALAAHSMPVGLRRGRLTIHVDQPGDNFALAYQRMGLLEQLKAQTNGRVEELVIRPGELPVVGPRRRPGGAKGRGWPT